MIEITADEVRARIKLSEMNEEELRAFRINAALGVYLIKHESNKAAAVRDLIADLIHYCHKNELSFTLLEAEGRRAFAIEIAPEIKGSDKELAEKWRQTEWNLKFLKNGAPRYLRIYDNHGRSIDRYTIVFTGSYRHKTDGQYTYIGMNKVPHHPQYGFCQHESSPFPIDRPKYGHLGTKITWGDLPHECQKLIMQEYKELWS